MNAGLQKTSRRTVRGTDRVATALGWFSVALGLAQILAPRRLSRLVGVDDDGSPPALMRLRGVTEVATGAAILARPRPVAWLWARTGGDALDLALLGRALASRDSRRGRVAGAMAAVAGVAVPDVIEGVRLTGRGEQMAEIATAITVNRSPDRAREAWQEVAAPRLQTASVTFEEAPSGRGTEVRVKLVAAASEGEAPRQTLEDEVRRFKQVLETGEVVRSDGSPEGMTAERQLKQEPAQP